MREVGMNPETLAARLLDRARIPANGLRCSRLAHGGNNRTYKVCTDHGNFLLKIYFRHPEDKRDRLAAECGFVRFCAEHGVTEVPLPVADDAETGAAIFSWIEGRSLVGSRPEARHLLAAADFLGKLARLSACPEANALPLAAEACRSRKEHLDNVRRRIQRLQSSLAIRTDAEGREVAHFVRDALAPRLEQAASAVRRAFGGEWLARPLKAEEQILSPSDFGFHNALDTGKGLVFVDFEYAGWDDPLKTICDFVCQPAVPVDEDCLPLLASAVKSSIIPPRLLDAAMIFLPVYRVKWCCIMLNVFCDVDEQRRAFAQQAGGEDRRARRARQATLARVYFDRHLKEEQHGLY